MEGGEDNSLGSSKPEASHCEQCNMNPSKYKCPGCLTRSCSLTCVKTHKQATGCTGKRNAAQFVPLSQFDDNLIISDYKFLEEAKRVSESAQRLRMKLRAFNSFYLPNHLKSLRSAAASRRIKLQFFPRGMSKRENNRTHYIHRRRLILWTIEWRFHSTDVVLHDHGVNENKNLSSILSSIIENHMEPGPWNYPLKKFSKHQVDSLKCFIRKYPKVPSSPFQKLDMKIPIRELLANSVILEYPVVHVFPPLHSADFEVLEAPKPKAEGLGDCPSPRGIQFQEEVMENGSNVTDPGVVLFKKPGSSSPGHRVLGVKETEIDEGLIENGSNVTDPGVLFKKPASSSPEHRVLGVKETEIDEGLIENGSNVTDPGVVLFKKPASSSPEHGVLGVNETEIDEGLMDSEILAKMDLDDIFDFGSEFLEEFGGEGMGKLTDLTGIFSDEEEIEEGEIVE